jgi:signal peptidase I
MSVDKKVAAGDGEKGESWRDTLTLIAQALLIALLIRTFFFQPFNIPSGSMKSTLLVGDYIFVSKTSYGYSQYSYPRRLDIPYTEISIPLLPALFSGRIWSGEPKRGDVAVFRPPHQTDTDFIKRVIGLPGDKVKMKDGLLHINDKPVEKRPVDTFKTVECSQSLEHCVDVTFRRFEETLPGGKKHYTLYRLGSSEGDTSEEYVVPPGHFFMLGDNRNASEDSRAWRCRTKDLSFAACPFVPAENLVGRAVIIWFSGDEQWRLLRPWTWFGHTRLERFFNWIR